MYQDIKQVITKYCKAESRAGEQVQEPGSPDSKSRALPTHQMAALSSFGRSFKSNNKAQQVITLN